MKGRKNESGNCQRCGIYRNHLHHDHITPKFFGGSDAPDNIQLLCANCHEDKTEEDMRKITKSPMWRGKVSKGRKIAAKNPAYIAKVEALWTPERREYFAELIKPRVQEMQMLAQERITPEVIEKRNASIRNAQTDEVREKHRADMKKQWADPEIHAKRSAAHVGYKYSAETREKMSIAAKQREAKKRQ